MKTYFLNYFLVCFLLRIDVSQGSFFGSLWCSFFDCCDNEWKNAKLHNLAKDLHTKVYGQDIACNIVLAAVKSHVYGYNQKPLVMSFHGWPGSGKNYVTRFIMTSLYKNGAYDKNVHLFSGKAHFPLDGNVLKYQRDLADWVRGNVSNCETSMFIFDEVDKMPPGIFDSIKPYLDHHPIIHRTNFRNAIFIFLTNTGGSRIVNRIVELYEQGRKRQDLELKDFEDLVAVGAFNEIGGLMQSDTISGSVIDHYIPFLPLEEEHLEKCIVDAFLAKGARHTTREDIKEVMDYVTFGPERMKLFSNSGCKRISQKVATILEMKRYPPRGEL